MVPFRSEELRFMQTLLLGTNYPPDDIDLPALRTKLTIAIRIQESRELQNRAGEQK